MAHPKQTVENIRTYLNAPDTAPHLDLPALARNYAHLCHQANLRLRRCADFLREQLRTEAAAHAAERPPLLEFVDALTFAELPRWEQVCNGKGLTQPIRLANEIVREVRDATIAIQPLRDLLARHRYLALARAPLPDRLAVLRQLASADPGCALWKRDAEELERARLVEIRNEAGAATRGGDAQRLQAIVQELGAGSWQTPAAAELKETLAAAMVAICQSTSVARLHALVPAVREAFAARSHDQCRQVFAQWGQVVTEAKIVVPPELRQEILPMARWIDEQDDRQDREREFRAACGSLVQAVDALVPGEELELLYRRTRAFELDIPTEVEASYRRGLERARHERQGERRQQYALAAALVALVLLALGALVFVILSSGKH